MANPIPYNTGLSEEQIADAFSRALSSVQQEEGKGLTSNDYTDAEKAEVADCAEHVANPDIHVTAAEKTAWNAKADADAVYAKSEVDSMISDLVSRIEALEAASTPTEEV